ncbi:MAG TPA: ABC transporter ATP-binding protein, partial [Bradyrhizobium sp.]|nr:ABC transporter ATP-binding protein [Bradyrhizobium sp.]
NHVRVSVTALALGLLVSLPLAIAARNRPLMRGGKLLAEGTPAELSSTDDPYVGELLRTPRRQAERLGKLLPRDGAA